MARCQEDDTVGKNDNGDATGDAGTQQGGQQDDQNQTVGGQGGGGQGETPLTYEAWLEAQPDDVKKLVEDNIKTLRSALQGERQQRRDLAKQLRDATTKLEEGSEVRKELERLGGQYEAAEARAAFYEDAIKPEIGCSNPRLAYVVAQQDELIDRRGRVNWDALKTTYPELFKTKQAASPGHAGSGTGNPPPAKVDMDTLIRNRARGGR